MINQWSYSRLSCYEKCPKQAEFKFIKKIKEPGSPAMDRGKDMHKPVSYTHLTLPTKA